MIGMLSQNWWAFALRGVVAIALGILAFVEPNATLVALIAVFAAYALLDGVLAIAAGVSVEGGPRWMFIVGGVLGIALGLLTIGRPDVTAVALVIVIGVWAIAPGVSEAVAAYQFRAVLENEWLLVLSGVVSFGFGVLLIVAPGAGIYAVLALIGYYALLAGIIYLGVAYRLRSVHEKVAPIANAIQRVSFVGTPGDPGSGQATSTNPPAAAGT
jgi:uncharacterized membrane protein HdeD (DUF308 family)